MIHGAIGPNHHWIGGIAKYGRHKIVAGGNVCVYTVRGVTRKTFEAFDGAVVLNNGLNAEARDLGGGKERSSHGQRQCEKLLHEEGFGCESICRQIYTEQRLSEIKFSSKKIFITLKSDNKFTEVIIEDDGDGFSYDILSKIGEPYLKPFSNKNKTKTGLGLGIFIGKTLLEKNFAIVNCKNSKKNGASIFIKWKNEDLIKI